MAACDGFGLGHEAGGIVAAALGAPVPPGAARVYWLTRSTPLARLT